MSISRTLLFGSLTVSVISVVLTASIIATAGFFITQEEIEEQTQNQLISIRDQQKDYLNSHLADINKQIINYSNSLTIQSATKDFLTAFKYETRQSPSPDMERSLLDFYRQEFTKRYVESNIEIEHTANKLFNALDQGAKLLQYHFISNNPYAIGQKDKLDSLESKSLYGRIHAKYHSEIRSYLEAFNYYDIFIIDAETGAIIYSVFKEIDFGTSLINGPFRQSGLAEVFKKVRNKRSENAVSFSPFAPYTPSYEGPAAFIASPVLDESGETIAVLAFQMPIDEINSIMTFNKEWADRGMGETGETYLVSESFKAQSVNRGIIENHASYVQSLEERNTDPKIIHAIKSKKTNIGFQKINTEGVKAALNGQTGFNIYKDYRDINVLGAYTPIEFQGSKFALLSEIDEPEAYNFKSRLLKSAMLNVFIVSLVIVSIVTLIAWRFSSQLANQLDNAVKVAKGVARGEKVEIPASQRHDEIGELMLALNKMQLEVIGKFESDAAESKRITSAVEAASTSIMMADAELNIAYMNPAVHEMMRIAETDLQQALPHFKANELLGKNIDIFHKNPDHQRTLLSKLTKTIRTSIQIGPRHFSLIVTPIQDDHGARLGTIVEWTDKTAEVKIEQEVANLITAANSGDLSQRINTAEQEGFFKIISEGLNTLLEKITGFVDDIAILFESMSQGDLTNRIANTYQGDLELIKTNANKSISKVTDVLSQIKSASETVQTASNEVSQGADDLSQRTESQASSLEETACSMEELTQTVKQTADNATHSNNLAIQAKAKAEKGGKVVSGAITAMEDILEASNKISDIIGVIDEIAFQTNLLALNAAVEAARAGEQGRGFAVVAGEVRSLSQRSAKAAKEIKDLIRDSVHKVESGSSLVNESGKMLSEIVLSVDEVAKVISDVNNAAIEQNSGIRQVNQALSNMDKMTQQNAALAEETSATSRSMSDEANSMNRLISFFQISQASQVQEANNRNGLMAQAPEQIKPPELHQKTWSKGAASFSDDEDWEDF